MLRILWLLHELDDPALLIGMHDPEARGRLRSTGMVGDGHVRLAFDVLAQHFSVIHAVELIAAEDDVIVVRTLEEVAQVLPNSVGRALIPMGVRRASAGRRESRRNFA